MYTENSKGVRVLWLFGGGGKKINKKFQLDEPQQREKDLH